MARRGKVLRKERSIRKNGKMEMGNYRIGRRGRRKLEAKGRGEMKGRGRNCCDSDLSTVEKRKSKR